MPDQSWPWARGSATGLGSLPGTDVVEAAKMVFGELPDLPHLPELTARGPGADIIGRGAAFLTDRPVKVQAPGPWTLAASIDLAVGGRMVRDHGATRDVAESLTEGLRQHVAGVRTRMPDADLLLQIDEPSLPAVLAGE